MIYNSIARLSPINVILIHVAYCVSRRNKITNHTSCKTIRNPIITTRLVNMLISFFSFRRTTSRSFPELLRATLHKLYAVLPSSLLV